MQGRSNALWHVVIGVLVVVLVAVVAFVAWPRGDDPVPNPEPTVSVSESAPDPGPEPDPEPDPGSGTVTVPDPSTLDPEDFGGHPPTEILEPLITPWPDAAPPLPPQLGAYRLEHQGGQLHSSGDYVGPDGRMFQFVLDPGLLSFKARMNSIEDHHQVSYLVCGDWGGYPQCAASAYDADLVVGTPPGEGEPVTEAELVEAMDAIVEWYRAQG